MTQDQIDLLTDITDMRESAARIHGTHFADVVCTLFEVMTMLGIIGTLAGDGEHSDFWNNQGVSLAHSITQFLFVGLTPEQQMEATKLAEQMSNKQLALRARNGAPG